uniref:Uncharacterized protein n=1 Tax=Anopheles farauti TaxID=69004 RepID=A0A182R149_9DIPT
MSGSGTVGFCCAPDDEDDEDVVDEVVEELEEEEENDEEETPAFGPAFGFTGGGPVSSRASVVLAIVSGSTVALAAAACETFQSDPVARIFRSRAAARAYFVGFDSVAADAAVAPVGSVSVVEEEVGEVDVAVAVVVPLASFALLAPLRGVALLQRLLRACLLREKLLRLLLLGTSIVQLLLARVALTLRQWQRLPLRAYKRRLAGYLLLLRYLRRRLAWQLLWLERHRLQQLIGIQVLLWVLLELTLLKLLLLSSTTLEKMSSDLRFFPFDIASRFPVEDTVHKKTTDAKNFSTAQYFVEDVGRDGRFAGVHVLYEYLH